MDVFFVFVDTVDGYDTRLFGNSKVKISSLKWLSIVKDTLLT